MEGFIKIVCESDESISIPFNRNFDVGAFYRLISARNFIVVYENDYFILRRYHSYITVTTKKPTTFDIEHLDTIIKYLNVLYTKLIEANDIFMTFDSILEDIDECCDDIDLDDIDEDE